MHRAVVVALVALLGACGGGEEGADPAPPTTGGGLTTVSSGPAVVAEVDWSARTVSVVGTSYAVSFCEGDAPLVCVRSPDGEALGVIEHLEGAPVDDLSAIGPGLATSTEEDRQLACDPTYEVTPIAPVDTTLFDEPAVRYGFTATMDGTRDVERVVGYAANVDGRLHLVVAAFLADDGCLPREMELPLDVADDVVPVLDAIAAGSTL